jgi:transposase
MEEKALFAAALGLHAPWHVADIQLDARKKELKIRVDFERGGHFPCPTCRADCPVHDTKQTTWRHLDFFQFKTLLTVRHPRIRCDDHGVLKAEAPWGRSGSGFTFLFEAMIVTLAQHMPMAALARHVREHDTKLWRILYHHVEEARSRADYSQVESLGVDETSSRRRHNYVTFFMDLAKRRVLYGTTGKDAKTFEAFVQDLVAHGGDPKRIRDVCIDLSHAFKDGAAKHLPNARITFDRFHVVKLVNEAMDKVRRQERKDNKGLKRSKYLWLRNPDRLSDEQRTRLEVLRAAFPKSAEAYRLKQTLLAIYEDETLDATKHLQAWLAMARESDLEPFHTLADTVQKNWQGVARWFDSRIANGILEATNSLLQAAKAKARGYRNDRTFITMAYLIAGRLTFALPT